MATNLKLDTACTLQSMPSLNVQTLRGARFSYCDRGQKWSDEDRLKTILLALLGLWSTISSTPNPASGSSYSVH